MAILIPSSPAHDSSSAETWLFRKLSKLSDKYCVLHSLGSMRHDHKSWAEIDFTVIGPEGIFFIEVKGGTVGRTNGEWRVERIDGRVESLGRGPFFQVAGAEASTRRFLQNRHEWVGDAVVGYWVITPECELKVNDLGVDSKSYYDARNLNISAQDLINNMRHYWMRRTGKSSVLDTEQIEEIRNSLCADVPMVKSLRREIVDVAAKIHAATLEQERVLEAVHSNMRLLIKGPAGSGKSTLAVHEVDRQIELGHAVLYVCSSVNMAHRIARQFLDVKNVDVVSSLDLLFPKQVFLNQYDVLIIDEAQDLLSERLFLILDSLLYNGIAAGTWRMFLDPFQSVLFEERGLESDFSEIGKPSVMYLLDNVRTTKEIAVTASALGYVNHISGGIHGPAVELLYVDPDNSRKRVKEKIDELLCSGVLAGEILVLSFDKDSFWLQGELEGLTKRYDQPGAEDSVKYASAFEAKGLESVVVILVGIEELQSPTARQQAYIGATRASTLLAIVMEKRLRHEVEDAYASLAFRNELS